MNIREIGAFEAKTRLSELLEKVQRGQVFHITKRGKPVAVLRSVETTLESKPAKRSLVELAREIRAHSRRSPDSLKELVHLGHKF